MIDVGHMHRTLRKIIFALYLLNVIRTYYIVFRLMKLLGIEVT